MKKVYLIRPTGFRSPSEVLAYYNDMTKKLEPYFDVLSPAMKKRKKDDQTNRAEFHRGVQAIKQSDIVFCDFSETTRPFLGSCIEIALGKQNNKLVVIVMGKDNVHNRPAIRNMASIICENMDDAMRYLVSIS